MRIYHDEIRTKKLHSTGIRNHPWLRGTNHPEHRYYNFVEQPDLIETSLEDFMPFADMQAVQTFYQMLRWLNSADSILETNDTALSYHENTKTLWMKKKYEAEGRVMFFYRDHKLNLNHNNIEALAETLWNEIVDVDPDFNFGNFSYASCPTAFIGLEPPLDKQSTVILTIYYWAWGNTKEETFAHLDRTFKNLYAAFKNTNGRIKRRIPELQ